MKVNADDKWEVRIDAEGGRHVIFYATYGLKKATITSVCT